MINEVNGIINFLSKRPMLALAIAMAVAVLLVYYSFFISIIFASTVIVLLFLANYKKKNGVLIFCGVWLLATMLSTAHCLSDVDRLSKYDDMTVSGEFVTVDVSQNNGLNYVCEIEVVESGHLNKGDKLRASYTGPQLKLGQSFRANAKLNVTSDTAQAMSYYSENIYLFADLSNIVLTNNEDFVLTTTGDLEIILKTKFLNISARMKQQRFWPCLRVIVHL